MKIANLPTSKGDYKAGDGFAKTSTGYEIIKSGTWNGEGRNPVLSGA